MNLIKQLKLEHQEILKLFKFIFKKAENKENVLNQVNGLKELLELHLEREDNFLYPRLAKYSHEELQKLGNLFSESMKKYSLEVLGSLNKWINISEKNNSRLLMGILKKDFKKIDNRITIEENILFPAYNKYADSDNN